MKTFYMHIARLGRGRKGSIVQNKEKRKEEVRKMAFARLHWYSFNCSWNNSSAIQVVSFLSFVNLRHIICLL